MLSYAIFYALQKQVSWFKNIFKDTNFANIKPLRIEYYYVS